jgi:transcriptional regulator with XRE-family HTH domain
MKIAKTLADEAILAEIGQRISRRRLDLQFTQADLAEQAGVSKRTVERIEGGASAQMSSLIRIFRVLDLVSNLELMLPESQPRPMDLLKHKGKQRQRASGSQKTDQTNETSATLAWDDET